MSKTSPVSSCWDTASLGQSADVSLLERSVLGEHLTLCGRQRSPLYGLHAGAEEVRSILAGRVVTSVLVMMLLVGGSWMML